MSEMRDGEQWNYGAIDEKPVDYDFGEGYPEKWEYFEAVECSECGEVRILHGEEQHKDIENTECEGYLSAGGPMMNYCYPLPEFDMNPDEAAKKIAHLPVCLVHFEEDDEYALALTGGGMNLAWEICAAYVELGYLPPLHFANLPKYAGGPPIGFAAAKRVLSAMEKSIEVNQHWLEGHKEDVKGLQAWVKECEKKRKDE